ncbi:MAG: hypothetical protein JNG86_11415 [Verrucomicrobiaceae bacterium]|nr:hypothetical protein [Verrucomicrobiaceae bacterium]
MPDPEDFFARTGIRLADAESLDASAITTEIYNEWRAPRFGQQNPELMTNPLWDWLVRTGVNAYQAAQKFGGPSSYKAGPAWCFDRMGQSVTALPDGRCVFIAGEHEDYYDPDFYIYNDVVIWSPDGHIEILGYPKDVFPPTDFHTATLLDDTIVIIGNLGYPEQRRLGITQVVVLDVKTWSIKLVDTKGAAPQWLHRHHASWNGKSGVIEIIKGQIDPMTEGSRLRENLDRWELDPKGWQWRKSWECRWPRREIHRHDGKRLDLWSMTNALVPDPLAALDLDSIEALGLNESIRDLLRQSSETHSAQRQQMAARGFRLDMLESLHTPSIPHTPVDPEEDFGDEFPFKVKRIRVNNVIVRYMDEDSAIHMIVEGEIPDKIVDEIAEDLRAKLQIIQGVECRVSTPQ